MAASITRGSVGEKGSPIASETAPRGALPSEDGLRDTSTTRRGASPTEGDVLSATFVLQGLENKLVELVEVDRGLSA